MADNLFNDVVALRKSLAEMRLTAAYTAFVSSTLSINDTDVLLAGNGDFKDMLGLMLELRAKIRAENKPEAVSTMEEIGKKIIVESAKILNDTYASENGDAAHAAFMEIFNSNKKVVLYSVIYALMAMLAQLPLEVFTMKHELDFHTHFFAALKPLRENMDKPGGFDTAFRIEKMRDTGRRMMLDAVQAWMSDFSGGPDADK